MTQKEFIEGARLIQKIKIFGIKSIGYVALMAHYDRIKRCQTMADMSEELKEVETEIKRRENEKAAKG